MEERSVIRVVSKEEEEEEEEEENHDTETWVNDSSLDHKKRLPLRASTGVWKAAHFIIAIEFGERLSYFAIATNLITYLTKVIHQDLKTAAKNVNHWSGVTTMMPLLGGFLADAYLGRFPMVIISSTIYVLGLVLLTLSQLIPSLKPCDMIISTCQRSPKLHEVVFFIAIYLISIGTGGHKPSLESFGADQFDDDHPQERKMKMSFFNWWNFGLSFGLIIGVTVIAHIQGKVSWALGNIILTGVMAITLVIFLVGKPFYRYRTPQGSPFTPLFQVLVAAIMKRNLPYPSNPSQFHEVPYSKQNNKKQRLLRRTSKYRFLDKAAIIEETRDMEEGFPEKKQNPWRLATVTRVEELKLLLNMIPIWLCNLIFGICAAQVTTFYIKQAASMKRKIGRSFEIPPAAIFSLIALGVIITIPIYDRILVPMLRKMKGNERGISILQRIGVGMFFCSLSMIIAALVERKRLRLLSVVVVGDHYHHQVEIMSVFWLAPQFVIFGMGDGFAIPGLQEFFYGQAPDSMRSLGIAFSLSVFGVADFLSSLLITGVDDITGRGGRKSWFGKDLNHSRVDNFYWLLAVINGLNLCVYVLIAKRYSYKDVERSRVVVVDDEHEHEHEQRAG